MSNTELKQIAYVSHQVHDFSTDDVQVLMVKARRKNKELGLTGALLFDRPLFLQVLEGPPESVDKIINDIKADERHRDMDIIYADEHLKEREFGNWSMGCKILGEGENSDYKELDERVKKPLSAAKPNGDIAHQLLLDFREMKNAFLDI